MTPPRPLSRVCIPGDVIASVRNLAPDWYGSTALYNRYVTVCERDGRRPSRQVLYSSTLDKLGVEWGITDGRRRWLVTDDVAAGKLPNAHAMGADEMLTVTLPRDAYVRLAERAHVAHVSPELLARRLLNEELTC